MRAGNFTLNENFIMNSPKGLVNLQELTFLYELKSVILGDPTLAGIKEMHEDLHCVEESIQEAFGFPMDRNYHRFWEWPYCECPHFDNIDNWATPYKVYAGNCPIHGKEYFLDENSLPVLKIKAGQIWYDPFHDDFLLVLNQRMTTCQFDCYSVASEIREGFDFWEDEFDYCEYIGEL